MIEKGPLLAVCDFLSTLWKVTDKEKGDVELVIQQGGCKPAMLTNPMLFLSEYGANRKNCRLKRGEKNDRLLLTSSKSGPTGSAEMFSVCLCSGFHNLYTCLSLLPVKTSLSQCLL